MRNKYLYFETQNSDSPWFSLAEEIIAQALDDAQPSRGVLEVLTNMDTLPTHVLALGKASCCMAEAAFSYFKERGHLLKDALIITKTGHAQPMSLPCTLIESAHPIPDQQSLYAGEQMLAFADRLTATDHLLFLVSGGGSSLAEYPISGLSLATLQHITEQLLSRGATIHEMNAIRKHCSQIKGGRFAARCAPARITQILLSDVLGDAPDVIASGPACADSSTLDDVQRLQKRFGLTDLPRCDETPKSLSGITTHITGSVRRLCASAEKTCRKHNIPTLLLTDQLACEAREAGRFLAQIACYYKDKGPLAILCGGETTVTLQGRGKGGRNQELALAASEYLPENALLFSLGSDGTDGPTDAAGAIVSHDTWTALPNMSAFLANNDSYTALSEVGGLIKTGPTGTNVNDLTVVLIGKPISFE